MIALRCRRRQAQLWIVVAVATLAVAVLVIVPLAKLMQIAAERGGVAVGRVLQDPGLSTAAWHSAALACLVPAVAIPIGSAIAVLLHRADVPCRRLLRLFVLLPLLIPQFVLGYSWTQAYSPGGFTDSVLGVAWSGLTGPVGVAVVLIVNAVPLSYLMTAAGLAIRAQPDLERAARLSGAGGWTTLRTITVPLLRPVVAAEAALIFVATWESFAIPQVLGAPAGFETLTTRIYSDFALASDPNSFLDAVTLAIGLVLVAFVVLLPADLLLGPKLSAVRTGHPGAVQATARRTVSGAIGAAALVVYTALAVALPALALLAAAVTKAIGLPPTPSNWTLANFRSAWNAATADALGNSLRLAVIAACVLVVFGAGLSALRRTRIGRTVGTVVLLTFAVPGSALAVGLLIAYGRWIGDGIALILVAYLAKFWALAHRTIVGTVERLPPAEWQAARSSGAGPAAALRTVWLPALAPALAAAWLLVFLGCLHELTMSSLLYSGGNQTIAVAVLDARQVGNLGGTAALCVLLTAIVVLALAIAWAVRAVLLRSRQPMSRPGPVLAGAR